MSNDVVSAFVAGAFIGAFVHQEFRDWLDREREKWDWKKLMRSQRRANMSDQGIEQLSIDLRFAAVSGRCAQLETTIGAISLALRKPPEEAVRDIAALLVADMTDNGPSSNCAPAPEMCSCSCHNDGGRWNLGCCPCKSLAESEHDAPSTGAAPAQRNCEQCGKAEPAGVEHVCQYRPEAIRELMVEATQRTPRETDTTSGQVGAAPTSEPPQHVWALQTTNQYCARCGIHYNRSLSDSCDEVVTTLPLRLGGRSEGMARGRQKGFHVD